MDVFQRFAEIEEACDGRQVPEEHGEEDDTEDSFKDQAGR
jgi:hypothetical protein